MFEMFSIGAGDLTPAARLLLRASLDVLGDDAHLLGALHDELRAARLLGRRRGDLLHRLGDAADGVGHLLAALGLLDGRARDGAHHVRALLRALEDLLQGALGLVRDLDAAVDVVRAALDGGDGVLALGLHRLDEIRDLARARAGALGQILDLVGDDGEALALLAGLRGDDGGVEREQVRLLGDVVDDVDDLADRLDARAEVRDDRDGLLRALLDAVDLADRLQDGLGALLGVERDLFREARGLVGVALHLIDRDVHLVHRASWSPRR